MSKYSTRSTSSNFAPTVKFTFSAAAIRIPDGRQVDKTVAGNEISKEVRTADFSRQDDLVMGR